MIDIIRNYQPDGIRYLNAINLSTTSTQSANALYGLRWAASLADQKFFTFWTCKINPNIYRRCANTETAQERNCALLRCHIPVHMTNIVRLIPIAQLSSNAFSFIHAIYNEYPLRLWFEAISPM